MNWLAWVWMVLVVAPCLLLLMYTVGIQYQAGGWLICLAPLVLIAFVLDVLLNWTVFVVYTWDWPSRARAEFTLSQRLARLIARGGRIGRVCLWLALALNELCPLHDHVSIPPHQF